HHSRQRSHRVSLPPEANQTHCNRAASPVDAAPLPSAPPYGAHHGLLVASIGFYRAGRHRHPSRNRTARAQKHRLSSEAAKICFALLVVLVDITILSD